MKKEHSLIVITSLILGVICGLLIPDFMNKISFLGIAYMNLLRFMIIPVMTTTVFVAIYKIKDHKEKILGKTLITFIIMFVVTFLLTTVVVLLLNPAANFKFPATEWTGEIALLDANSIINNLVPDNLVDMLQKSSIFAIIVFSGLCGFAASKIKNGKKAYELIDSLKDMFSKVLEYIIFITPLGVFSLIGMTVANHGIEIIKVSIRYIGVAYLASALVMIFVMIIPAWLVAGITPLQYIKNSLKVWLISISTCSSAATLPYTINACNENFKTPERITNIVVPLGCTIHKCGGAVAFALLGLFTASVYGVQISLSMYLFMLLSATLINMAAPGIPNGGVVIGAAYLQLLGLPLGFLGFYRGIYKLLDMSYTTLNVTGDITANIIIEKMITDKKHR